jgi:transposase-like protein
MLGRKNMYKIDNTSVDRCFCGGYIILNEKTDSKGIQEWICTDCGQKYYRSINSIELYKTRKEAEGK